MVLYQAADASLEKMIKFNIQQYIVRYYKIS